MLVYILQVQACIALFWIVYRLFMHDSGAFKHNRFYLLGTLLLSFVIPALSIPVLPVAEAIPVAPVDEWEPIIRIWGEPETAQAAWSWQTLAIRGYLLGAVILLGGAVWQLIKLALTARRGRISRVGQATLVDSDRILSAHSFFHYIFLNSEQTGREKLPQVVAHEMAHVRLRHSYDAVFAQILLILLWWNPFVWLWSRSLKEVHEFQADEAVLDQGFDSQEYIELLVRTVAGIHPEFVSGFSYSLIKKRLLMMSKHTNRLAGLRTLASVPALAVLLLLFSFTERKPVAAADDVVVIKIEKNEAGEWGHSSLEGIKEAADAGKSIVIQPEAETPMGVLTDLKEALRQEGILQVTHQPAPAAQNQPADSETREPGQTQIRVIPPEENRTRANAVQPPPADTDAPFMIVENMPTFESGDINSFRNWVQQRLNYPVIAMQNGIQGRVTVSFVIEKDGTLGEIKVISSPDQSLSSEAMRVIARSPKWTPGTQRGQAVRVSYAMPVTFVLDSGEKSDQVVASGTTTNSLTQLLRSASADDRERQFYVNNELKSEEALRELRTADIESIDVINSTTPARIYITLKGGPKPNLSGVDNTNSLGEVVVTGYGVMRKEGNEEPVSVENFLQGTAHLMSRNGESTAVPLFIVDGKRLTQEETRRLDPATIQTMEVLKEEKAVETYGEEGRNGVVLITLKK